MSDMTNEILRMKAQRERRTPRLRALQEAHNAPPKEPSSALEHNIAMEKTALKHQAKVQKVMAEHDKD